MGNLYNLVIAVIKRAKDDYVTGKYQVRKDVEAFMLSDYYNLFTGFDNGKTALAHWEDLRLQNLGKGDIDYGRLHIIEGAKSFKESGKPDKMKRLTLIVSAKDKTEAIRKAVAYGLKSDKAYMYHYAELSGCTKSVAEKLSKSNTGVVLVHSEAM